MRFFTRKLIRPEDLNANDTLFGGSLLRWIDEEAGIYAMSKLRSKRVVTKYMSEINFVASAKQGDVIEIGLQFNEIGRTSITFGCEVRQMFSRKTIITIDKIVFVLVDENGRPKPHGVSREDILNSAEFQLPASSPSTFNQQNPFTAKS
ncbi:MAG: hotdog domain-containing protein [Bacteroidota bacterium]